MIYTNNRFLIKLAIRCSSKELNEIIPKIDNYDVFSCRPYLDGINIYFLSENYLIGKPKIYIVFDYKNQDLFIKKLCRRGDVFATIQCSNMEEYHNEIKKWKVLIIEQVKGEYIK